MTTIHLPYDEYYSYRAQYANTMCSTQAVPAQFHFPLPVETRPFVPEQVECVMCKCMRYTMEKDKWGDWVLVHNCPGCGHALGG